ncbi:MAG: hypothetical protein ACW98W_20355 [Candidatus Hodarchaeales archaeon]|jgi:hypothetical protein
MSERIVKEGKGHIWPLVHKWKLKDYTEEDKKKFGADFENVDVNGFYAKYRFLYQCKCGAEMLEETVSFI